MAQELTVGIVGCGKIAHVDHVPHLLKVKGVSIVGLYDLIPEKMKTLNHAFSLNAREHDAYDSLLSTRPDALVICTPNSLHYPHTMEALKVGCHVLCEKPMAASTPECTRMVNAAKKTGKVLHINQTLHYLPPYITLAQLIEKGKIGNVRHVRCLRFHTTSPDVGWSPGAKWFVSKAFSGGIVLDIGVHMADAMKWIAGPVREVTAITDTLTPTIDVVDNARAMMRFENGATGILELSWTAAANSGLIEVYGDKGTLRMGFASDGRIEWIREGKKGAVVNYPKPVSKSRTSQQAFVDAVRGKSDSPTSGELGREAVALCEAILKAGETGKTVKIKRFI